MPATDASPTTLLKVEGLKVQFVTESGLATAVDGVSFTLARGETLAVVGESGSGKSVSALTIMGLLPRPNGRWVDGTIHFDGRDLGRASPEEMRRLRGTEIGIIFQEPMTSLNPVMTVGEQIAERLRVHAGLNKAQAAQRAIEMLDRVRIPEPALRAKSYPHQMSGGMRQRVMIAIALALGPKLLIADEPTTALDVTIQAQILDLMRDLQQEFGMAILFITHDLAVVAEMADRVVVMYAGQAVEEAPVDALFAAPRMPYTKALLRSIPHRDHDVSGHTRLDAIGGSVPQPFALPSGCHFHPRCHYAKTSCSDTAPLLEPVGPSHQVRCGLWRDLVDAPS